MGVKTRVEIQRCVEDVFTFASNSSNLPRYDRHIHRAKKVTDGPIDIGTLFHLNTNQFGLRMILIQEFIDYEPIFRVSGRLQTISY